MSYTAYKLDDGSRQRLLAHFPPKFPDVIAHHATIVFGVSDDGRFGVVGNKQPLQVVGYAEGDGIEAVVVSVAGSTTRPDGKTFHITVSLDRSLGRKPVDSNKLIQEKGWNKVQPFVLLSTFEVLN